MAVNLANAWDDRGDDVTLLVTYSGRGECFYRVHTNVRVIYLADLATITGRTVRAYYARIRALRRFIQEGGFDVVISFLTNVNVGVLLASRGLQTPIIVSERTSPELFQLGRSLSVLRRMTYPWAHRVTVLTNEALAWLRRSIPHARGTVIPNSVAYPLPNTEPVLPCEQFVRRGRRLLLSVGRLDEGKQFNQLIEAFSSLSARHPGWDLAIVGDGPSRNALERSVVELGLTARVKMPGRAGNVANWYERADLYALTSRFEGFPNTLVEAMAHGCAVVSYDCQNGPRDIVRHNEDGLLVTPGNVIELTKALDRLMTDDAERRAMANRALDVRNRFSTQRILEMWDKLFDTHCVPTGAL